MAAVFPSPLTRQPVELTVEEHNFWLENGYVAVANAVPLALCKEIAARVRWFIGATAEKESWYANKKDIYDDDIHGKKPHHGPCGMVQLFHDASLWKMREWPRLHGIFADLYGTEQLWVTMDRAHFKPPENPKYPEWSDPGPVHGGLHWDTYAVDGVIPFAVQGVLYLEDTAPHQGALRVVPKSVHRPSNDAVPVPGSAGTLVVWHSATLHGPGRNTHTLPRISAYITMLPVDAAPFQPPNVAPDAPLNLADAGTLDYDDATLRPHLQRMSQHERMERWRHRRPLLREDPIESDLTGYPYDFFNDSLYELTPLGRKLVGLDDWEEQHS